MKRPAVNEIIQDPLASYEALREAIKTETHCSLPGIVKSFDPATQTATIQPAIRSKRYSDSGMQMADLPLLANVPVYFPGGGQYALTMPVQPGDECLVVFADSCIDAWYQSGGVQNQIDFRSHDLSDGFAFVGFRSRPKAIENFPMDNPSVIGDMDALKGPAGKSAYQLWLDAGNSGTVEEYMQSLVGPAGAPGSDASVTKAAVEAVLTGTIDSHGHTPAIVGAAPASHSHDASGINSGVLPIVRGGTGGATAAAARTSLRTPAIGVINSGVDLNTILESGMYRIQDTHPNMPAGVAYGQLIVSKGEGSDTIVQIACPYTDGSMYRRSSWGSGANWTAWRRILVEGINNAAIGLMAYPVGSIYMSTSATSPTILFGGSWERYAVGRVLVGVSEGEAEFAGPGYAGGEKYHALTVNEMPSHNHRVKAWSYQTDASRADFYAPNQNISADNWDPDGAHVTWTGGNWGHNNMQPFISVYIWRRTA